MLKSIENDIIRLIRECAQLKDDMQSKEQDSHDQIKKLLNEIIDIIDVFDRQLANMGQKIQEGDDQAKTWFGNLKSIRKMMGHVLRSRGVAEIDAIGLKAIPGYHYIVEVVSREGFEDETIIEELKKGYFWRNVVLRKAEVITVKNN